MNGFFYITGGSNWTNVDMTFIILWKVFKENTFQVNKWQLCDLGKTLQKDNILQLWWKFVALKE